MAAALYKINCTGGTAGMGGTWPELGDKRGRDSKESGTGFPVGAYLVLTG